MPVKEKLNTPAMKAHKAASDAFSSAKEKDAKASTPATKAALEAARKALQTATRTVNDERFKRVGVQRTRKGVAALRMIGGLFNPRSYVFNKDQGDKIITALRTELDKAEAALAAGLNPSTATVGPATEDFSL